MAVDAYMLPVSNSGKLYTSETQAEITSFKNPFTGRPTFTYSNLFELTSFSFQVEQALNTAPQSTSGRATFHQMQVVKKVDIATPQFFYMCTAGISFKYVDLFLRKAASGTGPATGAMYFAYGLENVIIKSISHSDSSDGEAPQETLSLEYRTLKIAYSLQNPDGSVNPFSKASWDQVANTGTPPLLP